jgi:glycosyltransferase involved in cell wall biosynthesis
MTLVSVVIPSYNHRKFLPAAVESILGQTHAQLELIVVDDGSTDGSREYLRALSDPRCTLVEQPNAGAHAAINRGLALARGKVLAILNSDDIFHPSRIEACLRTLDAGGCDLVATWLEVIDEAGAVLGVKQGWSNMLPWPVKHAGGSIGDLGEFATNLLLTNFVSTTSNVVFTRRLYERIGGMRNLRFAHDWDFLLRAAHEFRCELIAQPLLQYRIHPANTISSNRAWMLFEICWVIAVALRRLQGTGLDRGADSAAVVRFLGDNINVQGNDRLLWMIDQFMSARSEGGTTRPEEILLEDKALREAFMEFVVV